MEAIAPQLRPECTTLLRQLRPNSTLSAGPPALTAEDVRNRRYAITDMLDDLCEPRSAAEAVASGAELYQELADFYLRARGQWSATGKTIPRRLNAIDAAFCSQFVDAFRLLFRDGQSSAVLQLADEVLRPHGGRHFDGNRRDAPKEWRSPAIEHA